MRGRDMCGRRCRRPHRSRHGGAPTPTAATIRSCRPRAAVDTDRAGRCLDQAIHPTALVQRRHPKQGDQPPHGAGRRLTVQRIGDGAGERRPAPGPVHDQEHRSRDADQQGGMAMPEPPQRDQQHDRIHHSGGRDAVVHPGDRGTQQTHNDHHQEHPPAHLYVRALHRSVHRRPRQPDSPNRVTMPVGMMAPLDSTDPAIRRAAFARTGEIVAAAGALGGTFPFQATASRSAQASFGGRPRAVVTSASAPMLRSAPPPWGGAGAGRRPCSA
jgi:hypothetical protein